jgi:serine/threonine-protein kinase
MSDYDSGLKALLAELKRRRVVRVALIYGAVAFAGLQALDLVLPALGMSERVFSAMVAAVLVGFPVTLALSWIYDLTPRGWVRTGAGAAPASWRGGGALAVLVGIAVSVVSGWWLSGRTVQDTGADPTTAVVDHAPIERIAVMPFVDLSSEPDNAYFADGLTEELRGAVGRIDGTRVAGRASTFALRDVTDDPQDIGRQLGVQAVLAGSVRKAGDEVRINAELLSAADGLDLWTEQYEATVDDVFDVQAQIARAIADALSMTLSDDSEAAIRIPPSENVMAVDKVRWGRFNWNRRTAAGLEAAISNFEDAIAFDSTYAEAWAGLADSYILLPEYAATDPVQAIRAGRDAAEQALALEPDLAQAHASLGLLEMFDWEWAAAERSFRRALTLDATYATAHQWYANMLMGQRRWDEALERIAHAEDLDRLSTVIKQDAARILLNAGRTDEAITKAQDTLDRNPTYAALWFDLGYMFLEAGRFSDARDAFGGAGDFFGTGADAQDAFVDAVEAYATTGEPQALPGRHGYPDPSGWLAAQLMLVGQTDEALDVIERGVRDRVWDMMTIGGSVAFRSLDGNPRYEAALEAVGLN